MYAYMCTHVQHDACPQLSHAICAKMTNKHALCCACRHPGTARCSRQVASAVLRAAARDVEPAQAPPSFLCGCRASPDSLGCKQPYMHSLVGYLCGTLCTSMRLVSACAPGQHACGIKGVVASGSTPPPPPPIPSNTPPHAPQEAATHIV